MEVSDEGKFCELPGEPPAEVTREYRTDDLIVYWYPQQCSHAGKCWGSLPQVFKPEEKPWVRLEAAGPEEVIKAIDLCPTGALKYRLTEGSRVEPSQARGPGWVDYQGEAPAAIKIRLIKNGPLMVEGPVEVYDANGKLVKEGTRTVLCRCGKTGNQPFCDGTHTREGWKSE